MDFLFQKSWQRKGHSQTGSWLLWAEPCSPAHCPAAADKCRDVTVPPRPPSARWPLWPGGGLGRAEQVPALSTGQTPGWWYLTRRSGAGRGSAPPEAPSFTRRLERAPAVQPYLPETRLSCGASVLPEWEQSSGSSQHSGTAGGPGAT